MTKNIVFDQAENQIEVIEYFDLPRNQLYVVTGYLFAWLVLNELVNTAAFVETQVLEDLQQKAITPAVAFCDLTQGVLESRYMTDEGKNFIIYYFGQEGDGQFNDDFEDVLLGDLLSFNHVADSWENYHLLESVIDSRYKEFAQ